MTGVLDVVLPGAFGLLGTVSGAYFTYRGVKDSQSTQRSVAAEQLSNAARARRLEYERQVRQSIRARQQELLVDLQGALGSVSTSLQAAVRAWGTGPASSKSDLDHALDESHITAFTLAQRLPRRIHGGSGDPVWVAVNDALEDKRKAVIDSPPRARTEALRRFRAAINVALDQLGERFEEIDEARLAELADTPPD